MLYDALAMPDGKGAMDALAKVGLALEFIKDQYRHCKPILALGAGRELTERAGIPLTLPSGEPDPGLIFVDGREVEGGLGHFIEAIAKHRHFGRETDPPIV